MDRQAEQGPPPQPQGRPVAVVAGDLLQQLHHHQRRLQAKLFRHLQRPHRVVEAELEREIDVRGRGKPRLGDRAAEVGDRRPHPQGDEAGRILDRGDHAARRHHRRGDRVQMAGVGARRGHQRHPLCGVGRQVDGDEPLRINTEFQRVRGRVVAQRIAEDRALAVVVLEDLDADFLAEGEQGVRLVRRLGAKDLGGRCPGRGVVGVARGDVLACLVIVEVAGPGLPAKPAGLVEQLVARRGCQPAIVEEALVDDHRDRIVHVHAREVHERERAHAEAAAVGQDRVDLRGAGDTLVEEAERLGVVGAAAEIDQEAGRILHRDRGTAHALAERRQARRHVRVRRRPLDDLHQPHQRHRVEEVHAGDPARQAAGARDRGDRQRRGVGGEDRVLGDDGLQVAEDLAFDLQLLHHSLDDGIAVGEVGEAGGDRQAPFL